MPLFIFNLTPRQQRVFVIVLVALCSLVIVAGCCVGFGLAQLLLAS